MYLFKLYLCKYLPNILKLLHNAHLCTLSRNIIECFRIFKFFAADFNCALSLAKRREKKCQYYNFASLTVNVYFANPQHPLNFAGPSSHQSSSTLSRHLPRDFLLRNTETGVEVEREEENSSLGSFSASLKASVGVSLFPCGYRVDSEDYYLVRGSRDSRYERERSEEGSR